MFEVVNRTTGTRMQSNDQADGSSEDALSDDTCPTFSSLSSFQFSAECYCAFVHRSNVGHQLLVERETFTSLIFEHNVLVVLIQIPIKGIAKRLEEPIDRGFVLLQEINQYFWHC
jgi:hypothetical protein